MKLLKNLLDCNHKARALIFGIKHHLVDIFQVGSDYAPGANIVLHRHIQGRPEKIFSAETTRHKASTFSMKYNLLDLN